GQLGRRMDNYRRRAGEDPSASCQRRTGNVVYHSYENEGSNCQGWCCCSGECREPIVIMERYYSVLTPKSLRLFGDPGGQKGMALFVVLWVLTLLMVTVLSFSFVTRTETHATLGFKDTAERKFLAEAGIERAIIEILYRQKNMANPITLEGSEPWKADGTVYSGQLGEGSYTVSIVGEAGKLDINKAPEL